MKSLLRQVLAGDVIEALDTTERALRSVENQSADSVGLPASSYAEAHQLVASAYERLAVARRIIEARDA